MIKQKLLTAAIKHQMGMYWDTGMFRLNLRVVTGQNEHGTQTSRVVAQVKTLGEALKLSKNIYERDGSLACETLLDFNTKWRFGFIPNLHTDLFNQVRDMDQARRYQHIQPRWEEFRAALKGDKNA